MHQEPFLSSLFSELSLKFFNTSCANAFAVEINDIVSVVAENASGLILLQNDLIAVCKDLDSISLLDVQDFSDLDRKHDSSQLVNLTYYTGRFHKILLCDILNPGITERYICINYIIKKKIYFVNT